MADFDFDALLGLDAPPAPAPVWAPEPAGPPREVRKNVRRVGGVRRAERAELNLEHIERADAAVISVERANAIDRKDIAWGVAAVLARAGPQTLVEAAGGAGAAPRPAPLQVPKLQEQLEHYMRGHNIPVPGADPNARYEQNDFTDAMDGAEAPRTTCVLYADEEEDGGLEREAVGAGMRLHQQGAWQLLRAMAVAQRSDFKALAAGWVRFHTARGGDGAAVAQPYAGWEDDMRAFRARVPRVTFDGRRTPKGALMFHSTGTGKTAVSVAAMQAFWQQYDRPLLYVSTTAAVQSVIGKRAAVDDGANPCGGQAHKSEYAKLADLLFPSTLGSDSAAYDEALNPAKDAAGKCVQTYLGNPMTVSSRLKSITFKQAAEFAALTAGGAKRDELCNETKTRIGTRADFPRFGSGENMRSITNAIMIIDEAHNLLSHLDWDVEAADGDDADAARRLEARRAEIAAEKAEVNRLIAAGDVPARDALGAYELRQFLKSPAADGVTLVLLTATPGSSPTEIRQLCDLMRRSGDDARSFVPLISYYNGDDNTADFPTVRVAPMVQVPMHPGQAKEVNQATTPLDELKASTIPACAAVLLPRGGGLSGGQTQAEALAEIDAVIGTLAEQEKPAALAMRQSVSRSPKNWPNAYAAFVKRFGSAAEAAAKPAAVVAGAAPKGERSGLAALTAEDSSDDEAADGGEDSSDDEAADGGEDEAAASAAAGDGAPVPAAAMAAAAERGPVAEDDLSQDVRRYDVDVQRLQAAYAEGVATVRRLDPSARLAQLRAAREAADVPSPCEVPARISAEQRVDLMMQRAPKLARVAADMVGDERSPATKVFAYTQFSEAARALELMLHRKGWKMITQRQLVAVNEFLSREVPAVMNEAAVRELEDSMLDGAASYARVRIAFDKLRQLTYTTAEDEGVEPGVLNRLNDVPAAVRPSSIAALIAQMNDARKGILPSAARVHDACREAGAAAAERCVADLGRIASQLLGVYVSAVNMLAVLNSAADNDLRAAVNAQLGDAEGAFVGKRFIMLPAPAEAIRVFNHFLNRDGQLIMGIVATGTTLEGINLKTARRVLAIEPQDSAAEVRQLMGRARRYCSHAELPAGSRTVQFVRYASVHSEADIAAAEADTAEFARIDAELNARRTALIRELDAGWNAQMRERVGAVRMADAAHFAAMRDLRKEYDNVMATGSEFREARTAGGLLHARTAVLRGRLAEARLKYKAAARTAETAVAAAVNQRRAEAELQERLVGEGDGSLLGRLQAQQRKEAELDAISNKFFARFGVPITDELTVADIESYLYEARQEEEDALRTAYERLQRVAADYTVLRDVHERMRR